MEVPNPHGANRQPRLRCRPHRLGSYFFYEEFEGSFRGRLEVGPELARILQASPSTVDSKDQTLWVEKWNEVIWGNQWELDQMEQETYHTARQDAKLTGRGPAP